MAWTDIANELVAVGAKPFASTIRALRDNFASMAAGDSGAPRITTAALGGGVAAGNIVVMGINASMTLRAIATGSTRIYVEAKVLSALDHYEIFAVKNSATPVELVATSSTTFVSGYVDFSVVPGDMISFYSTGGPGAVQNFTVRQASNNLVVI